MSKKVILLLSVCIIFITGGAIVWHIINTHNIVFFVQAKPHYYLDKTFDFDVPQNVVDTYGEIKTGVTVGAALQRCIKQDEVIFVVDGGSGFIGRSYYFKEDGSLIEVYYRDDTIDPNEAKPIVDLRQYTCNILDSYSVSRMAD